mgnify:CR=1 FL=1
MVIKTNGLVELLLEDNMDGLKKMIRFCFSGCGCVFFVGLAVLSVFLASTLPIPQPVYWVCNLLLSASQCVP